LSKRFGKSDSPKKFRLPRNLNHPVRRHVVDLGKQYNLGKNEGVVGALDYWKGRALNSEAQAKEEIEELKDMVQKIGEENLRLKELLKENGIEYQR
jgi:hypothetical protein